MDLVNWKILFQLSSWVDLGMQIWVEFLRRAELHYLRNQSPWSAGPGQEIGGGKKVAWETQITVSFLISHGSSVDLKMLAGHRLLVETWERMGCSLKSRLTSETVWQVHVKELEMQEIMRK